MKIYLRLEAPYEWVKVNEAPAEGQPRIDSFGEMQALDEYVFDQNDELVGLIPGEWVSTHEVNLPAKSKKLFNAALPYALEESVSEDIENMHFICPDWKVGEACHVLAVSKEKMQQWKELVMQYQLPVTRLIPDHALVPLHDVAECSIALDENIIYAKKHDDYGVTLDKDFLDAWIMDVPIEQTIAVNDKDLTEELIAEHSNRDFRHWEFGDKVVHWLDYKDVNEFDLWGDNYRPSVRRSGANPYLLPLLIIAFVVVGKVGFDLYQTIALKSEISAIKKEAQATFNDTLPEFGEVAYGQERVVMEQVLSRLGQEAQSASLQSMLSATARILRGQKVTLRDLSFQNEELVLTCLLADFSQVDKLTKQLNANARLSASLQSSETDDGKIIANYLVSRKNK